MFDLIRFDVRDWLDFAQVYLLEYGLAATVFLALWYFGYLSFLIGLGVYIIFGGLTLLRQRHTFNDDSNWLVAIIWPVIPFIRYFD